MIPLIGENPNKQVDIIKLNNLPNEILLKILTYISGENNLSKNNFSISKELSDCSLINKKFEMLTCNKDLGKFRLNHDVYASIKGIVDNIAEVPFYHKNISGSSEYNILNEWVMTTSQSLPKFFVNVNNSQNDEPELEIIKRNHIDDEAMRHGLIFDHYECQAPSTTNTDSFEVSLEYENRINHSYYLRYRVDFIKIKNKNNKPNKEVHQQFHFLGKIMNLLNRKLKQIATDNLIKTKPFGIKEPLLEECKIN